jgi:fatty-acyl-CoA synthase
LPRSITFRQFIYNPFRLYCHLQSQVTARSEDFSLLSYSKGPDYPLLEITIGEQLRRTADRVGDSLAVVSCHQSRRLTWAQLDAMADRVARGLSSLGIRKTDRVGLWSSNCVEWVMLQMGCARAGAILVNINPAYRSHELRFTLRKSRMKAIFLWHADARADYAAILEEATEEQSLELQHSIYFDSPAWTDLLHASGDIPSDVQPLDVANIQYTSGTTGLPKGVMLTHRNQINNGLLLTRAMRYTEKERICIPVPLYHCFGCVIGNMAALTSGAVMVFPNWTFEPRSTLNAIETERCSSVYGVPAMFIAELGLPDFSRFDLSSLRTGMMAGAPCPVEIMKRVVAEMHCPQLTIGYGQTESTPVVTISELDDPLELRVSTIGKALPCTEMKIVSTIDGSTLPLGEHGEVCARGYMVMKGYDDEPEATARAIDADGWLHTGDLGMMRPDGYIHLTGRAKDMIIRGGENIYPREIEEFLYTHPKVAEVQVIGLPNEYLGEVVLAWIRLHPGAMATDMEIREFCRGKIAHFKIPEYIRFVDAFPTTVTGKIQKFKIREQEIRERGLQAVAKTRTA